MRNLPLWQFSNKRDFIQEIPEVLLNKHVMLFMKVGKKSALYLHV